MKVLNLILTTISRNGGDRIAIVQTEEDSPDTSELIGGLTWQAVLKQIEHDYPPNEWEIKGSPEHISKLHTVE